MPESAREQDAELDVVEGTLALGGTFALVIRDDALPALPPTNPAFTIAMRVFLTHDPTHDAYVGLFWKGRGNDDRTPSAWLAPGSTLVTFRVSTTVSTEVWGTANTPLPVREWCHIALSVDGRIMRFYVNGVLDVAVETNGDVVSNVAAFPLSEGPRQPRDFGVPGRGAVHAIALRDEDIQQMAARARAHGAGLRRRARARARVAPRLAAGVLARSRALRAVFAQTPRQTPAPEASAEEPFAQTRVATRGLSDALDADHLASFAEEQFALGDATRAAALKLAAASRPGAVTVAAERVCGHGLGPLVAAAGGHKTRLVLAAMLEDYGTSDSAPKPGRALYRLMAAASATHGQARDGRGDGAGGDAFLSGANAVPRSIACPRVRVPAVDSAAPKALKTPHRGCPTRCARRSALLGDNGVRGQLSRRPKRAWSAAGCRGCNAREGDLRGESGGRVLYLSRAADLGDARDAGDGKRVLLGELRFAARPRRPSLLARTARGAEARWA